MVVKNFSSGLDQDITNYHLFNGYKPLIISIDKKYLIEKGLENKKSILITLQNYENKVLASLKLKLIKSIHTDSTELLIFEGVKGKSAYVNPVHKLFNDLYYRIVSDKNQNIYLNGNLYDQVKIAYSIPRKIYLVTVGMGSKFNIFPTDLSGKICEDKFILSLRKGGKANEQIENNKKCLVSVIEADYFDLVYKLGKNHMKEISDINDLGMSVRTETSTIFGLPIPEGATNYFEIEIFDNFEIGIHNLHFCNVINSEKLSKNKSVLAHIHRDYAEWRIRNRIHTDFYIRKAT